MKLVGYADKLSVEPGSEIGFMVSSEAGAFDATLVRLIHGDVNPAGPGFKAEPVESSLSGSHPGVQQRIRTGSYVRVPHRADLDLDGSFTIHMWIAPTMPDKEHQTLLSKVSDDGGGYALRLERGCLSLRVGPGLAVVARVERPVELHTWYSVTAIYDVDAGEARLRVDPREPTASELAGAAQTSLPAPVAVGAGGDLLIAAEQVSDGGERTVEHFYNGKIDSPRIFSGALGDAELAALRDGGAAARHERLVAAWDFSDGIPTSAIVDASGRGLHGRAVNKPMRGATGWNWDGAETAWPHAPEQYGAIHFHDDDLDDAGWERSLGFTVPDELPSGVYAVHLQAAGEEDYIPFAVRPRRGRPTNRILWVMPVFSYLAYGNEHLADTVHTLDQRAEHLLGAEGVAALADYPSTPQDRYIAANGLNSLYDTHTDGSGVCYSSRLRPLVTMRPKYEMAALHNGQGSPHQFNADLHIVDWLHERGYPFDVVTDEDLHREGAELLSPYDVVLTGSHHEYWSLEMIRAAQAYLTDGGRLMYLAGNGMYWVTQHDPENGNGIEVRRRAPSTRAWEAQPGEGHLSATGELGGLWRYRGISPQSWLGVGFTAQGMGEGRPYERQPDSFSERGSWVFEGIGPDELIGDFPSLVNGYGAAGFELDRVDRALGTPHRTLILATALGFSDSYQHVSEEVTISDSLQGGTVNPLVRADMVLLEYPGGGAVFSPGSIAWSACLSHNGYDNTVACVTANVLDRFLEIR
jgi:N,N-dimethylformamidase